MSDAVRLLLDIEDVVWRKMGSASVEDVAGRPTLLANGDAGCLPPPPGWQHSASLWSIM